MYLPIWHLKLYICVFPWVAYIYIRSLDLILEFILWETQNSAAWTYFIYIDTLYKLVSSNQILRCRDKFEGWKKQELNKDLCFWDQVSHLPCLFYPSLPKDPEIKAERVNYCSKVLLDPKKTHYIISRMALIAYILWIRSLRVRIAQ
jgi:hypothetical protein